MGLAISVSKTLAAASANCICLSQTPLGAGALTLNGTTVAGGVATLDTQRRVLITAAADESAHTFVIVGTNEYGTTISETVTGPNTTTAASLMDYKTVTSITISAAATGALTVGTNGVGSTSWKMTNPHVSPVNLGIACIVSGTVNYTFEYTLDVDPCGVTSNAALPVATAFSLSALASKSTTLDSSLATPITAWRATVNSGTGTVTTKVTEAGIEG